MSAEAQHLPLAVGQRVILAATTLVRLRGDEARAQLGMHVTAAADSHAEDVRPRVRQIRSGFDSRHATA